MTPFRTFFLLLSVDTDCIPRITPSRIHNELTAADSPRLGPKTIPRKWSMSASSFFDFAAAAPNANQSFSSESIVASSWTFRSRIRGNDCEASFVSCLPPSIHARLIPIPAPSLVPIILSSSTAAVTFQLHLDMFASNDSSGWATGRASRADWMTFAERLIPSSSCFRRARGKDARRRWTMLAKEIRDGIAWSGGGEEGVSSRLARVRRAGSQTSSQLSLERMRRPSIGVSRWISKVAEQRCTTFERRWTKAVRTDGEWWDVRGERATKRVEREVIVKRSQAGVGIVIPSVTGGDGGSFDSGGPGSETDWREDSCSWSASCSSATILVESIVPFLRSPRVTISLTLNVTNVESRSRAWTTTEDVCLRFGAASEAFEFGGFERAIRERVEAMPGSAVASSGEGRESGSRVGAR